MSNRYVKHCSVYGISFFLWSNVFGTGFVKKSPCFRSALSVRLSMASTGTASKTKTVDSHLHVWANSDEASKFPFAADQKPPDSLLESASTSRLLDQMSAAGVDGALIVQPINHKFDHSYVAEAISAHPSKFKGMLLHDPSLEAPEAVSKLEHLLLKGFVGVRFNPYLWPSGSQMSSDSGLAVYKRCGQLRMPVGVMCFKGLGLHYDDIVQLLKESPDTMLILDHFGFTALCDKGEAEFRLLLSLAKFPSVHVKISALFRIGGAEDPYPYEEVRKKRFEPLLRAFGIDRLMFGTDFPFVLEQKEAYTGTVDLVDSWTKDEVERAALMGGTAERLFGAWGGPATSSN